MSTRKQMLADLELARLLEVRYDTPFRHEASNKVLDTQLVEVIRQLDRVVNEAELTPENRAILLLESWNSAVALLRRWAPPGTGNELKQRLSRAMTLMSLEPISEMYLTDQQRRRLIQAMQVKIEPFIDLGVKFLAHRKLVKANLKTVQVNGAVYEKVERDIKSLLQNSLFGLKTSDFENTR